MVYLYFAGNYSSVYPIQNIKSSIIKYYGARWKIEVCLEELKREIDSAETQTRNSVAVNKSSGILYDGDINHLDLCL